MSLRVLLADESASIHKVFQMGLQDFGAEVKSVHNGLDVIEVAENYQPHIIFADILLQKKNGYEVSAEIQQHNSLSAVPVILMWSSFMELDPKQYKASGALGELEKPFDVENMRKLIRELVESTQSQGISEFLQFPDSISAKFVEEEKTKSQNYTHAEQPAEPKLEEGDEAVEFDLEPIQEPLNENIEASSVFNTQAEDSNFDMYEVSNSSNISKESFTPIPAENWVAQPLSQNKVEEPAQADDGDLDQFKSMDLGADKKLNLNDFLYQPESDVPAEPAANASVDENLAPPPKPGFEKTVVAGDVAGISTDEKEEIIRSEVRAYLRANLKEQLPSLLQKVVREELENIMQQEMAIRGPSPEKA